MGYYNKNYNEGDKMPFEIGDKISFRDDSSEIQTGVVLTMDGEVCELEIDMSEFGMDLVILEYSKDILSLAVVIPF